MVVQASSWGVTLAHPQEPAFPKHSQVHDAELQQNTDENPVQKAEVWSSQGG